MDTAPKCCEHCGKQLTGKRRGARCCSDSCRAMNSTKRQQDDLDRLARIANKKIDELIASGDEAQMYLADIQRKIAEAMSSDGIHVSA
jgi:hypothetical protein